ncbi:hypothetical protein LMH87_002472 [Akanthomyces muscarius]|uniref:Uncharacterized protein n=1 Tax=Akanthomyces muscarius TaxID=2231603 RepID=A0A9W8UH39_AKAMU|nr:hypothetical protein LMH87_002472 [Akanthomyces muscarius]KAJ4147981.1 hypothetical protein LMH87_002472 [Akanthomyces muscarius]
MKLSRLASEPQYVVYLSRSARYFTNPQQIRWTAKAKNYLGRHAAKARRVKWPFQSSVSRDLLFSLSTHACFCFRAHQGDFFNLWLFSETY